MKIGIINRTSEAKKTNETFEVIENIRLAYNNAQIGKHSGANEIFEDKMDEDLEKIYGNNTVTITKDGTTYIIEITGKGTYYIDDNGVVDKYVIAVRPIIETSITQVGGSELVENATYEQAEITITVSNLSELDQITSIKLYKGTSEIDATNINLTNGTAKFTISKNGAYQVQVVGKAEGKNTSNSKNINVSGVIAIANVPERWVVTSASNTNNDWYAYKDVSTNEIITVNPPVLRGEMQAIKYKTTDEITGSKWANAMTSDGSMWVWIPRYAYKITSGYHTNSETGGTIEIKFLKGKTNEFLDGTPGTAKTSITEDDYDENGVQQEWLVHPAFLSDASKGGGFGSVDAEKGEDGISGLWFAKFEISGSTTIEDSKITSAVFKSISGVASLVNVKGGDFYKFARQQTYGENGTEDTEDEFISFGQSHMMKNSEWGVTAYLTLSKYGANDINISRYWRETSKYDTPFTTEELYSKYTTQSTTKNPYGVYEMCGKMYELTAAYVDISNSPYASCLTSYGAGMNTTENVKISTKYKTVYPLSYSNCINMKGDAIWEMSEVVTRSSAESTGWGNCYREYPDEKEPFFMYGGYASDSLSGVLAYLSELCYARELYGSRLVLVF